MVYLGKTKIFKGQILQAVAGRVRRDLAGLHGLQELMDLVPVHAGDSWV